MQLYSQRPSKCWNNPGIHFVKDLQAFHPILNDISNITTSPPPHFLRRWREEVKIQLEQGQESMGNVPLLSRCSLPRNSRPQPNGVLEHCHEG